MGKTSFAIVNYLSKDVCKLNSKNNEDFYKLSQAEIGLHINLERYSLSANRIILEIVLENGILDI